jgi:hypothetical protein
LHNSCAAIVSRLAGYDRAVEVGVGRRPVVATGLAARGVDVLATDLDRCEVPPDVSFAHEDVTEPDPARYERADVVYALRCPPELQRPVRDAARLGDADCFFTTLGTDPAVVPAEAERLDGVTLFRARTDGPGLGGAPPDGARRPADGGGPA